MSKTRLGKSVFCFCIGVFIFLTMLASSAFAELHISETEEIYTYGEKLQLSVTVMSSQDVEDFLKVGLICGESSIELYNSIISVNVGAEKVIDLNVPISKSLIGEISGECSLYSIFGLDYTERKFKIEKSIKVKLNLESIEFAAGEKVNIMLTAEKANDELVNGFAVFSVEGVEKIEDLVIEESEVINESDVDETESNETEEDETEIEDELEETQISKSFLENTHSVKNGVLNTSISFPKNTKSGTYILTARVYEKNEKGEITNEGEASVEIRIKQTPRKIEIAVNEQEIKPGNILKIKILLYDQASDLMSEDVGIKIFNTVEEVEIEKLAKTNEEIEIQLEKNSIPGYWRIEVEAGNIISKRIIYILENEEANFEIKKDGTLVITNIGNAVYDENVEIKIENKKQVIKLNLPVGESKELKLSAPDGKYEIIVRDSKNKIAQSNVALTGNAVKISEVKKGVGLITRYPITWIFLIIILGFLILIMTKRISKKKYSAAYPPEKKEKKEKREKSEKVTPMLMGAATPIPVPKPTKTRVKEAEHTLVIKGNKQTATIISLKIKNMRELKKHGVESLKKIIEPAHEKKATAYKTGQYILLIFAPSLTKTFKNDVGAVKTALQISKELREHNRKFREKIEYGIGINSGEIIAQKQKDKLKFTAVGNTITLAKKISDLTDNEYRVLHSRNTHVKVIPAIKDEKISKQGMQVYFVKAVSDREKHSRFVSDFLNKLKREKKIE